jgi:heat shock protein HslJ
MMSADAQCFRSQGGVCYGWRDEKDQRDEYCIVDIFLDSILDCSHAHLIQGCLRRARHPEYHRPFEVVSVRYCSARLVGVEWRWQRSLYNNDTQNAPAESDRYTLILKPDGKVNIRADCNRGGGTYALDGNKISIAITHTTRAACPPGSLGQANILDLNGVAGWFVKEGDLYLDIKFDTGTMKFNK